MASRTLTLIFTGDNRGPLPALPDEAYPPGATPVPTMLDTERDGFPHNAIAHPLLVLAPPLGRWLHAHTEPIVPTWHTRWSRLLDRVVPPSSVHLP